LVANGIAEANSWTTSVLRDELETCALEGVGQHPIDSFREARGLVLNLEGSDRGARNL
jgi:hypothetical protein